MNIVRFEDAPGYDAEGHHDMTMVRLQGREAGPSDTAWLGVSTIAPGGHTTLSASDVEKLYVVLEGTVTISNGAEEARLRRWDSCRIAPGEGRMLRNQTNDTARILLVMPHTGNPVSDAR